MRRYVRPLWAPGLCLLAAACAATPPPTPPPPPKPLLTPDQIDGVYRGTSTRYQADSRACPSPGIVTLRVVGAAFEYRWNGRTQLEVSISPDGAVRGDLESISLTGKLDSGRIEGDVTNGACAYHFRAVKRER